MQQDVNHYEVRGRVAKPFRFKRAGVFGKHLFQMRVETLAEGERNPVFHVVRLSGELAEQAYHQVVQGDTIHVCGMLKFHTWKESGVDRSAPILEAESYQFVAMSEERQSIQEHLERTAAR